jgi:hypothetical protein
MVGLSVLTGAPGQKDNNWMTGTSKKGNLSQESLAEKMTMMKKTKLLS